MSKMILVVDDDKNVRITLGDILIEKGYKIIEAATEKEALGKIHKENPDLILLDTRLATAMEGDKLCWQIKKVEKLKAKVIIYTGNIDVVDVEKARDAGADDYVMKTEDFSLLLKAIEKLI